MECCIVDGTYRIGKKIGFGGHGEVYKAIHLDTDENIAAKFEDEKSENLLTEFKAYTALRGTEGIPEVHYHGSFGGHNVLIMELFDESLADLLNDRTGITLPQKISFAKQLLNTLHGIHSARIIHFDIKAENIMLRGNNIFIADFGDAVIYNEKQFSSSSVQYFKEQDEWTLAGVILDLLRGEPHNSTKVHSV